MQSAPSLFQELGGEPVLRAIIDRFVDRLFEDLMIGFMFQRVSRERLKQKEFEFAARHLGAPVEYSGRELGDAHRSHRIFGGQFGRRLQILRETLAEFQVDPRIQEHWIDHVQSLRSSVVFSEECGPNDPKR